ncbi:hypothetical protein [Bradyrhizobium arachidis]|nr:hypothetical protein [Bradyrhizobium arachidis]
MRIGVQVALSLAFHAWGNPPFTMLLLASRTIVECGDAAFK